MIIKVLKRNIYLYLTANQINMDHMFGYIPKKFEKKKKVDNIVVLLITASGDGVIRIWSTDSTAELLLGNLLICRKHSVQS